MFKYCLVLLQALLCVCTATFVHAQDFPGRPYLTPANPTPSDIITVNIVGDGCEALDSGVIYPPPITREGNALQVVFTGGYWTDPLDCLLAPGVQTYPLASFPAGSYALDIIWRYPGMSGAIEQQDLGALSFTVTGGTPAQPISAPTLEFPGLASLPVLLLGVALMSLRKRILS